jgi:hypothetical protein
MTDEWPAEWPVPPNGGPITDRERIDAAKARLRAEAAARDELAAEGRPPAPPLYGGAEFLVQPDAVVPWRIEGLWPAGGNVMLAAQSKAGKTTLRDNLVRSWCDRSPFLGRFAITPAAGPLVIIDAEMSRDMARRWLNAQMIAHADRFRYVNIRGAAGSFDVLTAAGVEHWAEQFAGAGAVLLDCLGPVLAGLGLDEMNTDVGRFLAGWHRVLAEAGVPESVIIHHMGHHGERTRGASRLRDWPDAEWQLNRQNGGAASSARFFQAFGRDVDVPESVLDYDPDSRWLRLGEHGSRTEQRAASKAEAARPAVVAMVAAKPGLTGRQLAAAIYEDGNHTRDAIRAAIKLAIDAKEVITRPGEKGANLHYPK